MALHATCMLRVEQPSQSLIEFIRDRKDTRGMLHDNVSGTGQVLDVKMVDINVTKQFGEDTDS